jgi:hypothetical protein
VNVEATIAALRTSLDKVAFADAILLTDAKVTIDHPGIRIVPIAKLDSSRAYSHFILKQLADHIKTTHCLVIQWVGFVLDAANWDPNFLEFDYVGAPWPQFKDKYVVGNGGFSLRSRRLLEACRDTCFKYSHPEDLAICRVNRDLLESKFGIRFADEQTAERFAFERRKSSKSTFGFHGVFNLIEAVGAESFWNVYASLDDPTTAFADYPALIRQLGHGRHSWRRRLRLSAHWLRYLSRRSRKSRTLAKR